MPKRGQSSRKKAEKVEENVDGLGRGRVLQGSYNFSCNKREQIHYNIWWIKQMSGLLRHRYSLSRVQSRK